MDEDDLLVTCIGCGTVNAVPPEAQAIGKFRCLSCGLTGDVEPFSAGISRLPGEAPEDDNTPTDYNHRLNTQRAEVRDGTMTCGVLTIMLLGLALLPAAVAWLAG